MIRALARLLLGSYPPWWRRRYGGENRYLTEELLAQPGGHRWRTLASLLFGSVLAWSQIRRLGDYLKPEAGPNHWGVVPRGSHRDIFGNRGLWRRSETELEPDEVLLGVVDGVAGNRLVAGMPMQGVIWIVVPLLIAAIFGPMRHFPFTMPVGGAVLSVIALVLGRLTTSCYVSVAVTSHGVVIFHRGITVAPAR